MTIRTARPDEAARVYAITRSAFLEYAGDVPPPSALLENEADVVKELQGETHALLAERDGKPLGCVRFEINRTGLHFFRLAVLPSARRQGVARALLAELEVRASEKSVKRLWCHVRPKVSRNVALYQSVGYAVSGDDVQVRGGFMIRVEVMEKCL